MSEEEDDWKSFMKKMFNQAKNDNEKSVQESEERLASSMSERIEDSQGRTVSYIDEKLKIQAGDVEKGFEAVKKEFNDGHQTLHEGVTKLRTDVAVMKDGIDDFKREVRDNVPCQDERIEAVESASRDQSW